MSCTYGQECRIAAGIDLAPAFGAQLRVDGVGDPHMPETHWVAAESLDAALLYLRKRHDDFTITEARFLGMIPLLSGSPLD